MKIIFSITILSLLLGISLCHKEPDNYRSRGIILGPDLRDCVCCGGWYLKIDTTEYEFDTLPDNSDIDLQKEIFPLNVRLDWLPSEGIACPFKRITISRIIRD